MPPYKRRKAKGPLRGPKATTLIKTRKLYDFIASHIREKGYPPSYREMVAATGIPSTSTIHYYLDILQEVGLVESVAAGKSRAIKLAGTSVSPPAGLMGRTNGDYTKDELEAALLETGKILVEMYDGFSRQKHWLYRIRHPVEVPKLAQEIANRFSYDPDLAQFDPTHERQPVTE